MLAWFGKGPIKTLVDINDTILKNQFITKVGLRQLLSCVQCGQCLRACPQKIDLGQVCLEARHILHRAKELPDALYEYWMQDLDNACGERGAFHYVPPQNPTPRYLFFPGCQLAASDPAYVVEAHRLLDRAHPGQVALLLYCCGAPADWAGQEQLNQRITAHIRQFWEGLGRPVVVFACATCKKQLARALPERKRCPCGGCCRWRGPRRGRRRSASLTPAPLRTTRISRGRPAIWCGSWGTAGGAGHKDPSPLL